MMVVVMLVAVVEVMFGLLVNVKTQPNPAPFDDSVFQKILA